MRIFKIASLYLGLIAVVTPAFAQIQISVNFGPPPLRYEVRSAAPAVGWIWVGGYYTFNDGRRNYDWVPGRWEAPPSPHHVWIAPRYTRRAGHYDYYAGSWRDNNTYIVRGKNRNPGNGNGRGNGKGNGNGKGRGNGRGNGDNHH